MESEVIADALRFVTRHGFAEAAPRSEPHDAVEPSDGAPQTAVRFVSLRATIDASYNDRDGFDCSLTLAIGAGTSVSLGTLIAALKLDELPRARSPRDVLDEQAQWLRTHLEKVLEAPRTVTDDCLALRFYHAGPWRKEWGSAIVMDAESRNVERGRLDRLRSYFGLPERIT